MKMMAPPLMVTSASGVYLTLADGRPLIDGISSWWCMIHGYAHPNIVGAISDQANTMPHVMLGGLTHSPAERLAATLATITPGDLRHVFFSDSGSVGVEVALKMAIQFFKNKGIENRSQIAFLEGAYHGDTLGAMSVCDPDEGMHRLFTGALIPQLQLPRPPQMGAPTAGYIESVRQRLSESSVCALIVEPIMQGAGGFYVYDSTVLEGFRTICDELGIILIADEVATGFGRTGKLFACEWGGIVPDIMVLGKALTGGHIGMAATIARPWIFEGFWSDSTETALMHGPTFMGNPMACRAALESIRLFQEKEYLTRIQTIEMQLRSLHRLRILPQVKDVRVIGAMGAVIVHDNAILKNLGEYAVSKGVWLRPFGDVIYTAPPYIISEPELERVLDVMVTYLGDM